MTLRELPAAGAVRVEATTEGGTPGLDTPDTIHYRNVASLILQGKVIPFLGAGVNLCARDPVPDPFQPGPYLPSGSELANYLAAKWEYPPKDSKDLLRVSQYIGAMLTRASSA